MGLLVVSPSHYEGLMWMGLWFVLLAALPIIYNLYQPHHRYLPIIPMQFSMLQTIAFILFMLSMYCTASMLPCGRYYYEPEGGYVGNPWVKFSYQYAYLYMAWIMHHLDIIEHWGYRYTKSFMSRCKNIRKVSKKRMQVLPVVFMSEYRHARRAELTFSNIYKINMAWNSSVKYFKR
jgi:hypothetical protein